MDTITNIELFHSPDYKRKLIQCIHCGLCLQACPTYAVYSTEMDAPRGRIAMIRAAAEGKIDMEGFRKAFSRHILLCLACRSCETACPSGVKYGEIIETARIVVEQNRRIALGERFLRWLGTKELMLHPQLLKALARLLWIYEKSGFQTIIRSFNLIPRILKTMEGIIPPIDLNFTALGKVYPAIGKKRGQVMFFTGCIQEAFLAPVNQATRRVLQYNGYDVFVPEGQTCCGAAHLHLGDSNTAKAVARQNIDVFGKQAHKYDAIISNAGGCGASLKEYPHLLWGDPVYEKRASDFSKKVKDVSEFLVEHIARPPQGSLKMRVTYADSCHLRHAQKVSKQPRQLLKTIPGLELVELQMPDRCCGSAGVYNIAQAQTAEAILDDKIADIVASKAEVIATSNTGCYMQLLAGVRRSGGSQKVMHVVEVMEISYRLEHGDILSS
jgi:glycolate oxidase iron-sulfur subunit